MKTYSYRVVIVSGTAGDLDKAMSDLGAMGYRLREVTGGGVGVCPERTVQQYPAAIFEREEPEAPTQAPEAK